MSPQFETKFQSLKIASPCSASWEAMQGDDKMRFCSECKLHVYNFSAMRGSEIQELIESTEGRLCARLYQRKDGTLITRDCPVGLRLKRRLKMLAASVAGCLGLAAFFARVDFTNGLFRSNCHSNAPLTLEETLTTTGMSSIVSRGYDFIHDLIYGRPTVVMGKMAVRPTSGITYTSSPLTEEELRDEPKA